MKHEGYIKRVMQVGEGGEKRPAPPNDTYVMYHDLTIIAFWIITIERIDNISNIEIIF